MGSIRETLKYAHIDLLWASLEDACKDINMNNNEWIKNYCLRKTELNEWLDSVLIRFLFFFKSNRKSEL